MNPDVLFEKFPDIVFGSLRKQMLLGMVPADTVRRILEPLLSDFHHLMLALPSELRADFENILRLYPDVAERFAISIKPPVLESLRSMARYAGSGVVHMEVGELDLAAEPQARLSTDDELSVGAFANEGQGFFTTDRGGSVYIEFFHPEGADRVYFEYKPCRTNIEIYLGGIYTISLTPRNPKAEIPLDRLIQILGECSAPLLMEIKENPESPVPPGQAK